MPARSSLVPVVVATLVLIAGSAPGRAGAEPRPSRFAQRYKQLQQRLLLEGAEGRGGDEFLLPGERAGLPPTAAELAGPRGAAPAGRAGLERALAALVPDVRVNNPTGDATAAVQSEVSIGALGDHVLIAFNDGDGFTHFPFVSAQGYAYSTDGGQSFVDGGSPPGVSGWHWDSDPVVAVNEATGDFWYLGLNGAGGENGIALVKGSFSGGTVVWGTPQLVRAVPDFEVFLDKPWMTVDPASGRLYVTYTAFNFNATSDTIDIQSSADDGLTWSDPLQLSANADAGFVQGSRVVVGPAGEVYATWYAIGQNSPFLDRFAVRKSTNGAASFNSEVTGAQMFSNFSSGAPGFNRPRGITFPAMAVDRSSGPHRGRVYLAWNECINFYLDHIGELAGVTETEGNDTPAAANSFTVGDSLTGSMLASGEIDFFKFTATQGQTLVAYAGVVNANLDLSLRLLCTDQDAQLALSAPGAGQNGLLVFTIPATGTYYLRLKSVSGAGDYTIYTGFHTALPSERARDHRDVFINHSEDGAVWSVPARVNDDPPYLDNWLPEVAVSNLSKVYAIWYDWRDASASRCNAQSTTYLASSDDGGTSWSDLGPVSNASSDWTDWTGAKANIMPNQGDYLGLYADCQAVYAGWGDLRDADVNVYAARYPGGFEPAVVVFSSAVAHPHLVTLSWQAQPVQPLTGTVYRRDPGGLWAALGPISADGAGEMAYPDSTVTPAHSYEYRLGIDQPAPSGQLLTCPVAVDVPSEVVHLSLDRARPNPTSGDIIVTFQLPSGAPAQLRLYDLTGREIHSVEVGSLGPGRPTVNLGAGLSLHPGLYFVRLTQGGDDATTRVTLLK